MSNDVITVGTKTTTDGEVISGASGLKINGLLVALVGDIATCKCGSKPCKGQGKIVATSPRNATVGGKLMARVGDFVDTGCGNCYLVASQHQVSLATNTESPLNIGSGVSMGNSVMINGVPFGGGGSVAPSAFTSSSSMMGQSAPVAAAQTNASALSGAAMSSAEIAGMTRQFNEVTQGDIAEDLRSYLEPKHTQVCILSDEDMAKCILNLWNQKSQNGERFGPRLLALLDEIRQYIEIGTGAITTSKLAIALGGMGITAKEYKDLDGKGRVIISSLWNDPKKFYAVVNGLNVKKNHPYLITNPTIKQLGVLAEDTIKGFKKGAVITMIVSVVINTDKLAFDTDYYLVDWFGHVGSDLFKAMTVFVISGTIVTLTVFWGITLPIIAGYLLLVGVDVFISSEWKKFELEDKIVTGLKGVVSE